MLAAVLVSLGHLDCAVPHTADLDAQSLCAGGHRCAGHDDAPESHHHQDVNCAAVTHALTPAEAQAVAATLPPSPALPTATTSTRLALAEPPAQQAVALAGSGSRAPPLP